MRHHMVVHLQPIGMITEVMERRLQSASPDLAQMHESMDKINGYSRAAVQSCLDVVSWLAPEDGATVALDMRRARMPGPAAQQFQLPRLHAQGRSRRRRPAGGARRLAQCAAGLPAGADRSRRFPAETWYRDAAGLGRRPVLTVASAGPIEGAPGFAGDAPYRLLEWHEVEALARADGIGARSDSRRAGRLRCPDRAPCPPNKKRLRCARKKARHAGRTSKGDSCFWPGAAATGRRSAFL